MFYHGKICPHHPKAQGKRYSSCRKCVPCHNIVAPKARRVTVKMATPKWADTFLIGKIYKWAWLGGKVVDHIIPLNHPKVCGLHVSNNLRAIPKAGNLEKGNRFRITTSRSKRS